MFPGKGVIPLLAPDRVELLRTVRERWVLVREVMRMGRIEGRVKDASLAPALPDAEVPMLLDEDRSANATAGVSSASPDNEVDAD